jgi:hypothetical protein
MNVGEAAVAASPNNADFHKNLARYHSQLGGCFIMQARRAGASHDGQMENWREARNAYQRSLDIWSELCAARTLSRVDANRLNEVAQEIARCNAALAK